MSHLLDSMNETSSDPVVALFEVYDEDFSAIAPQLFDFLSRTEWDKKSRKVGSLSIFAQDGKWTVVLNCRETDRSCFLTYDSLKDVFENVEHDIVHERSSWKAKRKTRLR